MNLLNIEDFIESFTACASDCANEREHSVVTLDHMIVGLLNSSESISTALEECEIDKDSVLDYYNKCFDQFDYTFVSNLDNLDDESDLDESLTCYTHDTLLFVHKVEDIIKEIKLCGVTLDSDVVNAIQCIAFSSLLEIAPLVKNVINNTTDLKIKLKDIAKEHVGDKVPFLLKTSVTQLVVSDAKVTETTQIEDVDGKTKTVVPKKPLHLEKYCTLMTCENDDEMIAIGRDDEINAVIKTILRKKTPNALLLGDSGVGKTHIINGLVRAVKFAEEDSVLSKVKVYRLNMNKLLTGASMLGEIEKRLEKMSQDIKNSEDLIFIFMDDFHKLCSKKLNIDIPELMSDYLDNGSLKLIGTTTYEYFNKIFEDDPIMENKFTVIHVKELKGNVLKDVITQSIPSYESFHKINIPFDIVDELISLTEKFIPEMRFPLKAFNVLDNACAAKNLAKDNSELTIHDIQLEVSKITNVPFDLVAQKSSDLILNLASNIKKTLFGQDHVVDDIVQHIKMVHAGLRDKNTIQGAFMLVGSSGTGKTEFAKALANSMGIDLVRFDMSEYMHEHTVSKLIGSPPGYIGHDKGNGKLLDEIEKHPNCVLLLDEIEKAHPNVLLTFLQVMDEGRLTGSSGKTVHFDNVIMLMTSNLGVNNANAVSMGFGKKDDGIVETVKREWRPEVVGRIDKIIRFNDINDDIRNMILDKNISDINDIINTKGYHISLDNSARTYLLENGYSKEYGARSLKKCISDNIKKPLSDIILSNQTGNYTAIIEGDSIVLVK